MYTYPGWRDVSVCVPRQLSLLALLLLVANACLLATPASARAGEPLQIDGKATTGNAGLTFAIFIPSVLRILENTHPAILQALAPPDATESSNTPTMPSQSVSALQRLVLVSTLGKGFCMDLHLTQVQVTNWRLTSSSSNAGIWTEATEGGYRLCARKAGRYEVSLQHNFELTQSAYPTAKYRMNWPVNVSLANP